MVKVIALSNQKGGVGKSTNNVMYSIIASKFFNKKVLHIDMDLQANSTFMLSLTFNKEQWPASITRCLDDKDLKEGITHLTPNLDAIAGDRDFRNWGTWLADNVKGTHSRTFYFKQLLDKIKDQYDYIFIDTPPATDIKVDNIMVATDYVIVVQETKRFAFEGSKDLTSSYLQTLYNDFSDEINIQVAGILLVLLDRTHSVEKRIVEKTTEYFGQENIFNMIVKNHLRLENYGEYGVQFNDYHDSVMMALFADLFCELESRINQFEKHGDILAGFNYKPKYLASTNKLTDLGKEAFKPNGIN
ncbi:ParA superfamily DNA segregation protein PrgP [Lactiplantibacillus plantarum]|uniref:ParA superfamily DNA segregation protein PrgP n=1 Tax=Lactiplantibacillus plantarum TaxID=1590 RepID=UPI001BAB559F|nr:ParA superfamily DNA segregation protein PrgP [Lactiplantibacillus plantarum]MBS0935690.1 AAA family ATPase [Lactiplantibacillus plantarum]MBS0943953.1 AAA family ATPase [Lactiplantibacillus plantarum]MBS0955458.1 AAA family ATPase [Lactiplantibacillus plantarum]